MLMTLLYLLPLLPVWANALTLHAKRDSAGRWTIPLTAQSDRKYTMNVGMGASNPQHFRFVLSTTSRYTAVAGISCQGCTPSGVSVYNASQSTSNVPVAGGSETRSVSIAGGNASGAVVKEDCSFLTENGTWWKYPNQTIVVANQSSSIFTGNFSGVLGLGTGVTNIGPDSDYADTFLGGWLTSHPNAANITVGLAVNGIRDDTDIPKEMDGGVMHLLKDDPSFYEGDVAWKNVQTQVMAPTGMPSSDWTVHMDGWKFKSGSVEISNSNGSLTIVEPYVPNIIIPQGQANSIYSGLPGAQQVPQSSNNSAAVWTLPCNTDMTFSVTFGDNTFELGSPELLLKSGGTCTGVIQGWPDANEASYVLGSTFAAKAYLIFATSPQGSVMGFALRPTPNKSTRNAIIGGVIGAVVGFAFLAFVAWFFLVKKAPKKPTPVLDEKTTFTNGEYAPVPPTSPGAGTQASLNGHPASVYGSPPGTATKEGFSDGEHLGSAAPIPQAVLDDPFSRPTTWVSSRAPPRE